MQRPFWFSVLALVGACGDSGRPAPVIADDRALSYLETPLDQATDHDPRPEVVEVNLVARPTAVPIAPGQAPSLWTYASEDGAVGRIPGPAIRARVGDRLVVRFRNQLPEPTTVHWHGLRVPNAMDGAHLSQEPIPAGGEFLYEFLLPDAGLFWFHPHHQSSRQVAAGLYAPLLVDDPAEPAGLGRSAILVLSDLDLGPDGALAADQPGGAGSAAMTAGRQGALVLVNGRERPTVKVVAGARQRWRVLNAARSRFMRIAVPGVKLQLVGGDGGLLEQPFPPHDWLLLTPGERADLTLVPAGATGTVLPVKLLAHDRGGGVADAERDLFYLQLVNGAEPPAAALPAKLRAIDRLAVAADSPRQTIRIGQTADGFVVNETPGTTPGHQHTSGAVTFTARVGPTHVLSVTNHTRFDHPFHLHGFFFQVLAGTSLVPLEPVEWKDTVNVPALSSSQLAVRFDDRPGLWMFHCHILDHAELGLSGVIDLVR